MRVTTRTGFSLTSFVNFTLSICADSRGDIQQILTVCMYVCMCITSDKNQLVSVTQDLNTDYINWIGTPGFPSPASSVNPSYDSPSYCLTGLRYAYNGVSEILRSSPDPLLTNTARGAPCFQWTMLPSSCFSYPLYRLNSGMLLLLLLPLQELAERSRTPVW